MPTLLDYLTIEEKQTECDGLYDVIHSLSDVAIRLAKERDVAVKRLQDASVQIDFLKPQTLEVIERQAILAAIKQETSIKEAASRLDISARKLYYKLKEYKEAGYLERRRAKLMICDDDANLIEALVEVFGGEYDLITASCVEEFTKRFTPDIDLIITDLAMPSRPNFDKETTESGFGLLKMAQEEGWKIPIVVISGHVGEEHQQRAYAFGASRFIPKPFGMLTVETAVKELISGNEE